MRLGMGGIHKIQFPISLTPPPRPRTIPHDREDILQLPNAAPFFTRITRPGSSFGGTTSASRFSIRGGVVPFATPAPFTCQMSQVRVQGRGRQGTTATTVWQVDQALLDLSDLLMLLELSLELELSSLLEMEDR